MTNVNMVNMTENIINITNYHNNEREQVNMTENGKFNKYYHNDELEQVNVT